MIHSYLVFLEISLAYSEVKAPNYNFDIKNLNLFSPGKPIKEIEKEYGKGRLLKKGGNSEIYQYILNHLNYNIAMFVQTVQGSVTDFYMVLPSYFLHDPFHQSLIDIYGKHDEYVLIEGNALYEWKNKNGVRYVYSATCTITCFPLFLTGMSANQVKQGAQTSETPGVVPILEGLKINLPNPDSNF